MNEKNIITKLISKKVLDSALAWLCQRRPACRDTMYIINNWNMVKASLRKTLISGKYLMSPLDIFKVEDGMVGRWCAQDALVVKALSLSLTTRIKHRLSPHCYHCAGKGGLKAAVTAVKINLQDYKYAFKTDISSFYYSMNHGYLMQQFSKYVHDNRVLKLIEQCINRVEIYNAEHRLITRGVCKGCSLSPLLGALYLLELDQLMDKKDVFYVRYMDDFMILTKKRHHLRKMVKQVYQLLKRMRLGLAKAKTFIGKVAAGFNFLGYRLSPDEITVAKSSQAKMQQKVKRLYEQGASNFRTASYLQRWLTWVKAGLGDLISKSLKSLTKTIHSIYKAFERAKKDRLRPEQFAQLIAA